MKHNYNLSANAMQRINRNGWNKTLRNFFLPVLCFLAFTPFQKAMAQPAAPLTLFVDQHVSCFGYNDGTVQASTTLTPNPGPWNFVLDGSVSEPSGLFLNLTPGLHTICASDGTSTYCDTVRILEPLPLMASFTVDSSVSCLGNDGQLSVNITGGTDSLQPMLTTWTDASNTVLNPSDNFATTISGLSVGSYTVAIEDNNGCFLTVSTTLGLAPPMVITPVASPIACGGGTTMVNATSSGGFGTVTYMIGTTALPAAFGAGTYTITGTDGKGCTATTALTLTVPTPVVITSLASDSLPGCTPSDFGGLTASISGGTAPYNVEWKNSANFSLSSSSTSSTASIGGLVPDTYSVIVTDANGCSAVQSYNMPMLCLFVDQHVSCFGYNDGTVQASSSLSGTVSYGVDGGPLNNPSGFFLNLTPGFHTICATNNAGVTTYCDTVMILEPLPLSATFTIDHAVSCNGNDGQISVNIVGGTDTSQPYLTIWTDASNTVLNPGDNFATTVNGLSVGSYTVNIEDNNGCFLTVDTTIGLVPAIVVTPIVVPITCFGATGTINASATGGDAPFTFTIGTTTLPALFIAGTYTVVATDILGCTGTTAVTITEPPLITTSISATACDSYTWTAPAGNGNTYTMSGAYTHTLEALNKCDSVITLNLTINNSSSSVTNAYAGNSYFWQGNTYTNSGTYTHTLSGANSVGCDSFLTLNLQLIPLSLFIDQHVSCYGYNDGFVIASTSATPNPGPWTYILDGVTTEPSGYFFNLTPGTHTICANDGSNSYCDTVTILEPSVLGASFVIDSTVSCHGNDGQISVMITGGTDSLQPYLTIWTDASNTVLNPSDNFATTIDGLSVGSYTVSIEDNNGCFLTVDTSVGLSPAVVVTASAAPINCNGGTSQISAMASGGDGVITSQIGTTTLPSGFAAGTYTVVATDARGCTGTTVITVTEPALITSNLPITACDTYTWAAPNGNGNTYIAGGTYTHTLLSANGCDSVVSLVLTINASSSSTTTVYAANAYAWHGTTYTTSGTYTHTIVGGNAVGCDSNLTLNLNLIPLTLFVNQHVSCFGYNDGYVEASTTAIPNPGPWTFILDGVTTEPTGNFFNLTPGLHTICAADGSNSYCDTVRILEPLLLTASFVIDSTVSCLGNDGQISVLINGGVDTLQPYLTMWTDVNNTLLNPTDNFATTISGLSVGSYTVNIEDNAGCFLTVDTTLGLTPPMVVTGILDPILCNGGSATIDATATGAYPPFTFAIGTVALPASFPAGTYTITATDAKGCTGTTAVTMTQPPFLPVNQTVSSCVTYTWPVNNQTYTMSGTYTATFSSVNGCDSSYQLNLTINQPTSSVTNAVGGANYVWAANNVTYTLSGTYTHTLVGGNAAGCDSNLTLNLVLVQLDILVDQHVSCFGNNDGSVQATGTGGSGSFTYDLDGANTYTNTSGFFIGLTPGTHTICAKESPSNAVICETVIITEPAQLVATFSIDSTVSCLGNDGQISISISGGIDTLQPYLTTWIDDNNIVVNPFDIYATTVNGLSVSGYTVTIEDNAGCFLVVDTVLGLTPAVTVTSSHAPIVCHGGTTVLNVVTSGGTGMISTTINGGTFTVGQGTYTLTATDEKGCSAQTVVTVTEPALLSFTDNQTACDQYQWPVNNASYTTSGVYSATYTSVDGCDSIHTLNLTVNYSSASVENVTAANTYNWIANGMTYTNSGTYTHTLVGANAVGCDSNLTLNLNIITISISIDQNVSCNGNNDGSVQAVAGGAGTFTFDIDGGVAYTNTTGFFAGLAPGTHTVCAKETASGVSVCDTITIGQPNPLSVTLTVDSTVSCLGNDGQITATITGGVNILQPYLTTWSAGVNTVSLYDQTVSGLSAGTYTVVVEDDNYCFATASITVGLTPAVTVSASNTPILCYGASSVISTTTGGGTGSISTSITGGTFTVTAGSYTITATDAKGCTATTEIMITEPALLAYSENQTACDSYQWPVNSQTYTSSGTYTATFLSVNGCDSNYTLNLVINYSSSSVENVVAANTYTWIANGMTYTNSGTYTHTLPAGNAVGCDSNLTLNLSIITVDIIVDQQVSCNSNNDGSVQATASGASGVFTYDIDGANTYSNTTGFFSGLSIGTHTICAKESPSNVVVCDTILITQPNPLVVTLTVDSTVSCLGNDGQITATITGGSNILQPYLTTWSAGVTPTSLYDVTVGGLAAGSYTVTVEDDNLCFATATVNVGLTPAVSVSATHAPIICFGGTTEIIPSASGGTGALTLSISGGTYTVNAGSYTITATDTKGCTSATVVNVTEPSQLSYTTNATACDTYTWSVNSVVYTVSGTYVASFTSVNGCDSVYTLNLIINNSSSSITNVTAANEYTWTANGMSYTVSGTYTHTIANGNAAGCDSNLTLNLQILTISVIVDQNISCNGNNDGSVQASVSGGTQSYTYDLDGANTYANTSGFFGGLAPGVHTICALASPSGVTVCGTVTLTQPDPLVVTMTVDSTVSCLGNDGQVTAHITGGTAILQPYLTTWSNGVTTTSIYDTTVSGLAPGTYTVTVEDDNLCFATGVVTVGTTPPVSITALNTSVVCFGGTAVIIPSSSGGLGALTTTITGGTYTVSAGTYTLTATDTKGCTSATVVTITQPALITSVQNVTASSSYTWPANNVTYTVSGTYTATFTSVNGCDSVVTLNLTLGGVTIAPKVYLMGPYVAADGMMHDSLRIQGVIPGTEPYSFPPYNRPNILDTVAGEHVVSPSVLAVTGPNAIVDWVIVELRDGNNMQTIVATKRALVQRDGDVVSSVDGVSPLFFSQNMPNNYFVSIKHRNHLGVMTPNALPLVLAPTFIDYTTTAPVYVHVAFPPISNAPRNVVGGVSLLWPGDANANKNVKYNGTGNDKQDILIAVGLATPNATVYGYRREDVTMDGAVKYNNADNDKNYILNTIGVSTPNLILYQHTPN